MSRNTPGMECRTIRKEDNKMYRDLTSKQGLDPARLVDPGVICSKFPETCTYGMFSDSYRLEKIGSSLSSLDFQFSMGLVCDRGKPGSCYETNC